RQQASLESYIRRASRDNAGLNRSQVTQQNASCSEELAATAEEMSNQAEQLQLAMEFFTLEAHTKEGKATSHLHPTTRGRFMNENNANSRERAATTQRPINDGDFVRF
ncbi:hypothetical protein Q7I35_20100, partial [Aeromonas allosaccharophila]